MAIYEGDVYSHNVFFTTAEGIPILVQDAVYTLYKFNDDGSINNLLVNQAMEVLDEDEPSSWTASITIPESTAGYTLYIRVSATNMADERLVREYTINIDSVRGMKVSFV